jgi:HEAT repeat protein
VPPTAAKKLVTLLEPEHPVELRRATALVLREIGDTSPAAAKAILAALYDEDKEVRLRSIEAAGKLRIEQALSVLLERVEQGGEEAEQAAHAAAHLGAKGQRFLHELMPKVAPGLRRYIAAALAAAAASGRQLTGKTTAVAMLLDTDPGVVEAAVRSISGEIPSLNSVKREALASQLIELVRRAKTSLPEVTELAVTRLLAALGHPRSEAFFWERIRPSYSPQIRASALASLGQLVERANPEQLSALFACASDSDVRVAASALIVLKTLPVSKHAVKEWVKLLAAPDAGVRQLALEKIGQHTDTEALNALMGQLRHPDRNFRDAVLKQLIASTKGREALGNALLTAASADEAWAIARAQSPFAKGQSGNFRQKLLRQAGRYLEADDRRAEAMLYLLRSADAKAVNRWLEAQATLYRKKKAYSKALPYLRSMAHDPACGLPIRLELVACEVKVSKHDLATEAWNADPSLQQTAQLWQRFGLDLVKQIAAIKWLDADDLYYLGFQFCERDASLRSLAAQLLRLAVSRSPRSKVAKAASSKLRREGLK